MGVDSFSIRKISDNSRVNLDEVDKLVCEKFNLVIKPNDYGHLFFKDTEKFNGNQKSISWVGFIHVIIYYSKIEYGYRDIYEILGALHEISNGSQCTYIKFPPTAINFLANLLFFLKHQGLYVYVEYDDSGKENQLENLQHNKILYQNESGWFVLTKKGALLNFYPDYHNLLSIQEINDIYDPYMGRRYNLYLKNLIIPDGVIRLPDVFMSEVLIRDFVKIPTSIVSMSNSSCVFYKASLPDIVIPSNITALGSNAFAESTIRSIKLPRFLNFLDNGQFRNATIEKLILPSKTIFRRIMDHRNDSCNFFYYNYNMICRVAHVEYSKD